MIATRFLCAANTRAPIHLLTSIDQCRCMAERILSSQAPAIAVDCEGAQLGRFGSVGLLQLATPREVFLVDVDAGGTRMLEPLAPLLGNPDVVKVFHDCREDASTLLHRYGMPLAAVFDTQIGHMAWLERRNLELYQASIAEVLRTFRLSTYRAHRWDELERKPIAPSQWQRRPLEPQAVRYAVEGVAHLLPLQRAICQELGDPTGDLVLRRSARYLQYADMNLAELPSVDSSVLRPGLPLNAMLAMRRSDAAYFKLNRAPLTGAVLDATDLRDFADVQPGDIVACRVKSLSDCRQFVHLQREGHGRFFYDQRQLEMCMLPPADELGKTPRRESSSYKLARSWGSGPTMEEERASYSEPRAEVVYKKGKRGQVKVRKTGFQPPRQRFPKGSMGHRSFPVGGASFGGAGH